MQLGPSQFTIWRIVTLIAICAMALVSFRAGIPSVVLAQGLVPALLKHDPTKGGTDSI